MPAPVIEYIAPSPAVSYPSFFPSVGQLNEAITGLVNPQFPITADETPHVPVVVQEIPEVQVVERIQEPIVEPIEALPQEHMQLHTAIHFVHVSVPRIQEIPQERLPGRIAEQIVPERIEEQIGDSLVPPIVEETIEVLQRSITAVEVSAPKVDGSRPLLVDVTVPMYNQNHQEQLVAREHITHVPVPPIQDPVEYDEPLVIGDMVLDTSGGLSRECEIIRIGHSLYYGQYRVLYPCERLESYSSGAWKHRDQLAKLTNKRRRVLE